MSARAFACTLVGSLYLACGGRIDVSASPGSTTDAGADADAAATADAAPTVDSGAMPESSIIDVPGAAACHVASSVASAIPRCDITLPANNGCGPSEYAAYCGLSFFPPDGCGVQCASCNGVPTWCCPCLGADAGSACVDVDLSKYDRSCRSDSDCVSIPSSGTFCCLGHCASAAINVNGRALYWQTVGRLQYCGGDVGCGAQRAACIQGVCTLE